MKTIIKILLVGLFLALIGLGLISCGARKVQKEQSKEQAKTELADNSVTEKQVDTNVKTTVETKVDDKNETITEETIYEPQDSSKESFIIEKDGTKVILSNAKKIVRNTAQKNNTQTEQFGKTEQLKKESEKEQKNVSLMNEGNKTESKKEVDKKQFNPLKLILTIGMICCVLAIIYICFKRLKII